MSIEAKDVEILLTRRPAHPAGFTQTRQRRPGRSLWKQLAANTVLSAGFLARSQARGAIQVGGKRGGDNRDIMSA